MIIRLPDQRGAKPPNGQPPSQKKIFASSAFRRAANLSVVPLLLRPAAHTTTRNYKHTTTTSFGLYLLLGKKRKSAGKCSQPDGQGNGLNLNRIWSLEYFSFPFSVSTPGKEEKVKSGENTLAQLAALSLGGPGRSVAIARTESRSLLMDQYRSQIHIHTHTQYSVAQHTLQSRLLQSYLGPGHYY